MFESILPAQFEQLYLPFQHQLWQVTLWGECCVPACLSLAIVIPPGNINHL